MYYVGANSGLQLTVNLEQYDTAPFGSSTEAGVKVIILFFIFRNNRCIEYFALNRNIIVVRCLVYFLYKQSKSYGFGVSFAIAICVASWSFCRLIIGNNKKTLSSL